MTDSNNTPISVSSKPRLSLSSKQLGIRQSTDEYSEDIVVDMQDSLRDLRFEEDERNLDHSMSLEDTLLTKSAQSSNNLRDFSKEDLLQLITVLRVEVQRRDVALSTLKCEQIKRLMNPICIGQSELSKTYAAIQKRLEAVRSQKNLGTKNDEVTNQDNLDTVTINKTNLDDFAKTDGEDSSTFLESDSENPSELNMLNALFNILDRHPFLALPRDSVYCLDYECDEQSTKTYLNMKLQHLEELTNQHRRYRYLMNGRLSRIEQKYLSVLKEYEREKALWAEKEKESRTNGNNVLLKQIELLSYEITKEKEKASKIVINLLNILLDEQERMEKVYNDLKALENENSALKKRISTLESVAAAAAEVTASPTPTPTPTPKVKTSFDSSSKYLSRHSPTLSASRNLNVSKAHRNSLKQHTEVGESNNHSHHNQKSTAQQQNQSTSKPNISTSPSSSGSKGLNSSFKVATTGSRGVTSRFAGLSSDSAPTPKIQSLFKSSSVGSSSSLSSSSSPKQKLKNLQDSTSVDSGSYSNSSSRFSRPVKPQVPAKPAQLVEQQQGSRG